MEFSETPALTPIVPGYRLRILTDSQLDTLQEHTLEVLSEIGVHCPSERALHIYAEHGADVNWERRLVRLPSSVVMDSLAHAPRFYRMGARSKAHDIELDGRALYCATDGCGVETIELDSGERRPSRKEDVARMARMADALPAIGFYWPMVSAQDHPATAPLHELEASFNNTVKHVQTETVMDAISARYAVEMATVVAGDREQLRQRPPLSSLICTIAPLALDQGGMESALAFAEVGLPVGFMSMANAGSTAPATLAGTVVVGDAEIAAAMVLIQMAYPGAPVFHSFMPGIMHPRTGGYLGTAWEGQILYAVGVEMAHRWGVPTLAGVFGTDARTPGWQSAADAAPSLMLCALCGAETGSGLGLLESCTLLSPESLVLDSDFYHAIRISLEPFDLGPDALAMDVIRTVGPGGHFLKHKHTREHIRRRRLSSLVLQPDEQGGYTDPVDEARATARRILQEHHPQPLPKDQQVELSRILRAAEAEFESR
jgi:trimethylamine--corrinoid protein Co-methyltransferase